ncbi:MAG TPA: hypothetical protein VK586_02515 [Streptosporangiaceae bacterium]|nr:hypothetical protein [Streptosporangiaceae bacterium]
MTGGSWWLVITLDRPYGNVETTPGEIRIPFATRESAERAGEAATMRTERRPPVIDGLVVTEEPPG